MPQIHVRDHACPDCLAEGITWLIHTQSKRCQRHTGEAFSKSSCSRACQRVHRRCRSCGRLAGGEHAVSLRDGMCWRAGNEPSCWREKCGRAASYDAICLLCGRAAAPAERRCGTCGGALRLESSDFVYRI